MKKNNVIRASILIATSFLLSSGVQAASAKDILISPLLIHIAPVDETEPVISTPVNSAIPGLDLSASSETVPALGLTYMLNEKLGFETYLAIPPTHDVLLSGLYDILGIPGMPSEVKGAEADMLPLVVFAQYHHAIPETRFTLIGGFGLSYTIFQNIDTTAALKQIDPTIKFSADDVPGVALQVGAQYALNDKYSIRANYTKMFLEVDLEVSTTALGNLSSTLTLDPDVFMLGMAYKL